MGKSYTKLPFLAILVGTLLVMLVVLGPIALHAVDALHAAGKAGS